MDQLLLLRGGEFVITGDAWLTMAVIEITESLAELLLN